MGIIDTGSVKVALKDQFSFERAKKAYGAGVTGAIGGVTANLTLQGVLADGKIDGTEVVSAFSFAAVGFILGFVGAWFPTQNTAAPKKGRDALVYGDGLADDSPRHEAE